MVKNEKQFSVKFLKIIQTFCKEVIQSFSRVLKSLRICSQHATEKKWKPLEQKLTLTFSTDSVLLVTIKGNNKMSHVDHGSLQQ